MGADRSVPTQYHYNSTTGKAEASGSAYSGGDGDFVTSGSLTLNDGDHITDSGGDNRITFTNAGSLILKDEAGNAGLTVDASQNVNLENGKILSVDTINEKASNAGVTVDGVVVKDGGVTTTATGGVILGKTATASDVNASAGAETSNNYSLSHTLTLDGTTADDAEHADVTITSDKCLATSVVVGCASLKVDVVVHTVVAGSFKFYFVNKSGDTLANDSTIVFNFTIM